MSQGTKDLQDLKALMVITSTEGDANLKRLLDAAWATAEKATGQIFNRSISTETESWIADGGSVYYPMKQPITAIASLTIDGEIVPLSTGYSVSGYYLSGYAVKLRDYEFEDGAECTLGLTYGLVTPPEDLRQAVLELAAIKSAGPGHLGQKSTTGLSKETVTYFDNDVTPSIQSVFDRHTLRYS